MRQEYYFEARDANGAVFIGHVHADGEEEARQLARQRYPYAVSIQVSLVG